MNDIILLDLINQGHIEEAKQLLKDSIYKSQLKSRAGARTRYSAMKKYFTYNKSSRACTSKPCKGIEFEGETYTSFTNSWSLIFTKEDVGTVEVFNEEEDGVYPNITRSMRIGRKRGSVSIRDIIASAKTEGYKLTRSEVAGVANYLLLFDKTYYKLGLVDASFSIIDDGDPAEIYKEEGDFKPIVLKTSLGYCLVLPIKYTEGYLDDVFVIKADLENGFIDNKNIVIYNRHNQNCSEGSDNIE